ncbi:hypothetical protein BD414DRAFT_210957 [Trametes punicea]|nr:hypothetical protein BD414DRAFT_210957 [Trametes punicea]
MRWAPALLMEFLLMRTPNSDLELAGLPLRAAVATLAPSHVVALPLSQYTVFAASRCLWPGLHTLPFRRSLHDLSRLSRIATIVKMSLVLKPYPSVRLSVSCVASSGFYLFLPTLVSSLCVQPRCNTGVVLSQSRQKRASHCYLALLYHQYPRTISSLFARHIRIVPIARISLLPYPRFQPVASVSRAIGCTIHLRLRRHGPRFRQHHYAYTFSRQLRIYSWHVYGSLLPVVIRRKTVYGELSRGTRRRA